MRVAIVENTVVTHHGQVGVALHEVAARIDVYKPWRDGVLPESGDHDALVVLGGEQSALADTTHPYLPLLAQLMRPTHRRYSRPFLNSRNNANQRTNPTTRILAGSN